MGAVAVAVVVRPINSTLEGYPSMATVLEQTRVGGPLCS